MLNPGAILGGCVIADNRETCSHPTERFDHMTSMFSDGCVVLPPMSCLVLAAAVLGLPPRRRSACWHAACWHQHI